MPEKKAKTEKKTAAKKPVAEKAVKKAAPRKIASKKAIPDIQRLRIKVSAYEHKILDTSVKQIVDTAVRYEGEVHGPVPLQKEDESDPALPP